MSNVFFIVSLVTINPNQKPELLGNGRNNVSLGVGERGESGLSSPQTTDMSGVGECQMYVFTPFSLYCLGCSPWAMNIKSMEFILFYNFYM